MKTAPDLDGAALLACRCLLRMGRGSLPVQPLDMLKRCYDTAVMTVDQAADALDRSQAELLSMMDAAEAWTYRLQRPDGTMRTLVVFRTDGHPARRRFSLAHELGHIVMHHHVDDPWKEQEANAFASHLLCPQPVLQAWAAKTRELQVCDVADACYVSMACAERLYTRPLADLPLNVTADVQRLFADAVPQKRIVRVQGGFHADGVSND